MKISPKIPILMVDNDRWSRTPFIVFEGDDESLFGINEWAHEKWQECEDEEVTESQIKSEMVADFYNENSDVDEFWPEHHILRAGDNYYRYTEDGQSQFITLDDAQEVLNAAIAIVFAAARGTA